MRPDRLIFFFASLAALIVLYSCAEAPVSDKAETKADDNEAVMPDDFSVFGRWILGIRGLYNINGEEVVDVLPPSATSPIVQTHYYEIVEGTAVQHFICVSPIAEGEANTVFEGDDRILSWQEGSTAVETDMFTGKIIQGTIYRWDGNSFMLRYDCDGLSYDPILVFARVEDEEWEENVLSNVISRETPAYEDKLKEYVDFCKNRMGNYSTSFSLNQFFW